LVNYPLNVNGKCMPQCQLDCNIDNPGKNEMCKADCQTFCNQDYPKPPSCEHICFENCYEPGTSMIKTCNQYCLGNPECMNICTEPGRPIDAPSFNSCKRICGTSCNK
jgi:hypothetical protein